MELLKQADPVSDKAPGMGGLQTVYLINRSDIAYIVSNPDLSLRYMIPVDGAFAFGLNLLPSESDEGMEITPSGFSAKIVAGLPGIGPQLQNWLEQLFKAELVIAFRRPGQHFFTVMGLDQHITIPQITWQSGKKPWELPSLKLELLAEGYSLPQHLSLTGFSVWSGSAPVFENTADTQSSGVFTTDRTLQGNYLFNTLSIRWAGIDLPFRILTRRSVLVSIPTGEPLGPFPFHLKTPWGEVTSTFKHQRTA